MHAAHRGEARPAVGFKLFWPRHTSSLRQTLAVALRRWLRLRLYVADRATGMVPPRAAGGSRAQCLSGADLRAALVARWPDRAEQVQELLQELAAPHGIAKPLLVCGAPASGKTAVVRCAGVLTCTCIAVCFSRERPACKAQKRLYDTHLTILRASSIVVSVYHDELRRLVAMQSLRRRM